MDSKTYNRELRKACVDAIIDTIAKEAAQK